MSECSLKPVCYPYRFAGCPISRPPVVEVIANWQLATGNGATGNRRLFLTPALI